MKGLQIAVTANNIHTWTTELYIDSHKRKKRVFSSLGKISEEKCKGGTSRKGGGVDIGVGIVLAVVGVAVVG